MATDHDVLEIMAASQDADHVQTLQLGDNTAEKAFSDGAELWQQTGFASRPAKATPGQAAPQALVLVRGGRDVVYATRDVRAPGPQLRPGEVSIFTTGESGTGGQGRVLIRNNGDIEIYSTTLIMLGANAAKSVVLGENLVEALNTIVSGINALAGKFNEHVHVYTEAGVSGGKGKMDPTTSTASDLSNPSGLLSSTVKVQV